MPLDAHLGTHHDVSQQMRRGQALHELVKVLEQAFGPGVRIGHVNWGDSERRRALYMRRAQRAFARSRRNQPPRRA